MDFFICQLSTNDAARHIELFRIEDAIRFILVYVKNTFGCPIVFYTGTYFESDAYVEMIHLLYRLQNEYDFYILDLYHDEKMQGFLYASNFLFIQQINPQIQIPRKRNPKQIRKHQISGRL